MNDLSEENISESFNSAIILDKLDLDCISLAPMSNDSGVIKNITLGNTQYFINYIRNKQDEHMDRISVENTISNENSSPDNNYCSVKSSCRVKNCEERMATL